MDLTDEERMLLTLRDELYAGSWGDFVQDLKDRLADKPYVFDLVPATPQVKETIQHHLTLIERLKDIERQRGGQLSGVVNDP